MSVEWVGRKGQAPRSGQVRLAWASFSQWQNAPAIKSTSDDDVAANAAVVTSGLDSLGRMETTITFPTEGGVGLSLVGVTRLAGIYSNYSAQLS
jgi:hypothetical protein